MAKAMSSREIWLARGIAIGADTLQFALLPLFAGCAAEGIDAGLDVVVSLLLIYLCGWHLAFLPSFVAEAVPLVDLFPSWTAAAFFVTRRGPALPARLRRWRACCPRARILSRAPACIAPYGSRVVHEPTGHCFCPPAVGARRPAREQRGPA